MKTLQLVLSFLLFLAFQQCSEKRSVFSMMAHWDEKAALENPHKGWYHHYPDNHINNYMIREDSDLLDFPGMDHLYMRLAWAYLEPAEGQYNWEVIDTIIQKWTSHGLGIAFRISCMETSTDRIEQQYATPKWVREAGAKGGYYSMGKAVGSDHPWEPVYDDPIFLEKLENFLKAFAERYDGQSWLRYLDVGSIGNWGEGHNYYSSQTHSNLEVLKLHIDLYRKYFKNTLIVVTDDYVREVEDPDDREPLHRYVVEHGITYRDDSPMVGGWIEGLPETFSVSNPEYFKDVYLKTPTIFELQHYGSVKKNGNWDVTEGSAMATHAPGVSGPDFFKGAMKLLHATYLGYHGYADEWLGDNPELTVELLNRCGYWYFLHQVNVPKTLKSGEGHVVNLSWENRGIAPAYHPYLILFRMEGSDTLDIELNSNNLDWMPDSTIFRENYLIEIPGNARPGNYQLKLKLYSREEKRDVFLPFTSTLLDQDNFYYIGEVILK